MVYPAPPPSRTSLNLLPSICPNLAFSTSYCCCLSQNQPSCDRGWRSSKKAAAFPFQHLHRCKPSGFLKKLQLLVNFPTGEDVNDVPKLYLCVKTGVHVYCLCKLPTVNPFFFPLLKRTIILNFQRLLCQQMLTLHIYMSECTYGCFGADPSSTYALGCRGADMGLLLIGSSPG